MLGVSSDTVSMSSDESRYFQTSAEDIHFCEILMTKCIKRIRDLFEYALYKFTLNLLTYSVISIDVGWPG